MHKTGNKSFVTGSFVLDTLKIDNYTIVNTYTYSANHGIYHSNMMFVGEHDNAGNYKWLKAPGGECYRERTGIINIPGKGIFVTGAAPAPLNFDGRIIGNNQYWSFMARLDPENLVGIAGNEKDQDISIFPNPAVDEINIKVAKASIAEKIILRDMLGRAVRSVAIPTTGSCVLNCRQLEAGVYFAEIQSGTKKSVRSVVISK
jgi:hypothetical protein